MLDSSTLPLQVGVKILLKNKEGKYLLLRRNPEKYPEMKSSWDIPGGRIHIGVELLKNLQREVKEETGLDLEQTPKLVAAQDIIRPDKHVVRLTFVGEIEGQPKVDQDSLEARWLSISEILELEDGKLDLYLKELIDNGTIKL